MVFHRLGQGWSFSLAAGDDPATDRRIAAPDTACRCYTPTSSFVTKFRPKLFTDPMLTFAETTMRAVCAEHHVELVEFNGEADHVHLLLAYPPTPAISTLVQRRKGRTAYTVRREFTGACVRARMRSHLWSPSYFAVSCGGAPLSIIKQYIDGQARPL